MPALDNAIRLPLRILQQDRVIETVLQMQLELTDQTLYPFPIALLVLPALPSSQAAELDAQEVVWAGLKTRGVRNMFFEEF